MSKRQRAPICPKCGMKMQRITKRTFGCRECRTVVIIKQGVWQGEAR